MDLYLKDKVIIVTGGGRGIGAGIAKAIAAEGGIPAIVDRLPQEDTNIVEEIEQAGGRAFYETIELSRWDACHQAVMNISAISGNIDGLVNNAGTNDGVGLEHGNPESFSHSLQQNLVHYFAMAHYTLPFLKRSKGSIVNITSKTAETGQGNTSGYAAANGGRNALTREWAVELLKYEIRVNAIVVAECYTPMYAQWIKTFPNPEQKRMQIENLIPLGKRMTTAEELGDVCVFLLSARASHLTGQLIHVDGGYVHLDRAIR